VMVGTNGSGQRALAVSRGDFGVVMSAGVSCPT